MSVYRVTIWKKNGWKKVLVEGIEMMHLTAGLDKLNIKYDVWRVK